MTRTKALFAASVSGAVLIGASSASAQTNVEQFISPSFAYGPIGYEVLTGQPNGLDPLGNGAAAPASTNSIDRWLNNFLPYNGFDPVIGGVPDFVATNQQYATGDGSAEITGAVQDAGYSLNAFFGTATTVGGNGTIDQYWASREWPEIVLFNRIQSISQEGNAIANADLQTASSFGNIVNVVGAVGDGSANQLNIDQTGEGRMVLGQFTMNIAEALAEVSGNATSISSQYAFNAQNIALVETEGVGTLSGLDEPEGGYDCVGYCAGSIGSVQIDQMFRTWSVQIADNWIQAHTTEGNATAGVGDDGQQAINVGNLAGVSGDVDDISVAQRTLGALVSDLPAASGPWQQATNTVFANGDNAYITGQTGTGPDGTDLGQVASNSLNTFVSSNLGAVTGGTGGGDTSIDILQSAGNFTQLTYNNALAQATMPSGSAAITNLAQQAVGSVNLISSSVPDVPDVEQP